MRQKEGLPGGNARRHGDRISTFLLPEGLHRMGSVGVSHPKRLATLHCPSPRGAGGAAQGLKVRLPPPSHQLAQRHRRDQSGGRCLRHRHKNIKGLGRRDTCLPTRKCKHTPLTRMYSFSQVYGAPAAPRHVSKPVPVS